MDSSTREMSPPDGLLHSKLPDNEDKTSFSDNLMTLNGVVETENGQLEVMQFEDMPTEESGDQFSEGLCFKNGDEKDSSDSIYSYCQNGTGCFSSDPSMSEELPNSLDEMKPHHDFTDRNEELTMQGLIDFESKTNRNEIESKLVMAKAEEHNGSDFFSHSTTSTFNVSEETVVSDILVASTHNETMANAGIKMEVNMDSNVIDAEGEMKQEICFEDSVEDLSFEKKPDMCKLNLSSEDEEVNFDRSYGKSGAESSSSKDECPSGPSCSSMSYGGINSLSSDSENDAPNINVSLSFKKHKTESHIETISSSSCSDEEGHPATDYANLTPEEIKALIDAARRIGSRCRCPDTKWQKVHVKGPTQTSSICTIGKASWSEKRSSSCRACISGLCFEDHKRDRSGKRRHNPYRSKPRPRGTIGQDVPVIDLSDSEEISPLPQDLVPEVIITTVPAPPAPPAPPAVPAVPAVPAGECIVLSSSEDDDDIVCERVIKAEPRTKISTAAPLMQGSPEVVVLNASCSQSVIPPIPIASEAIVASMPSVAPVPQIPDSEPWPDFNIDLDDWETMSLLANIASTSQNSGVVTSGFDVNVSAAVPDRPPTPEGWSCPICLESKTSVPEIMSTTCGHIFCGNCIRSSVKIHKKCPTCRKKLTIKQFHKIFL